MDDRTRDLARTDLWLKSLELSRRRRGLPPLGAATPLVPPRDMTDQRLWRGSAERAEVRRRLAADRGPVDGIGGRRVAVSAVVVAAVATAAEPLVPAAGGLGGASAAIAQPLERGDQGVAVKRAQRRLGLPADGIFGPGTKRAVKRFQRRHALTPDGLVGPATQRALRAAGRRGSNTGGRARSRGSAVARLQRALGIPADGVFGPQTARAVRGFQARNGLGVDGVVGPATWAALGHRGERAVLKRGGRRTGSRPDPVTRAIAAANRIAHLPYRYGGGHASFRDSGYDCSGSVSYVLHAAGVLGRPLDSGDLMSFGRAGRGRRVTVYANAGHAFMTIDGRRFDTTGRSQTGSRWQPRMRPTGSYVVRHPPNL